MNKINNIYSKILPFEIARIISLINALKGIVIVERFELSTPTLKVLCSAI